LKRNAHRSPQPAPSPGFRKWEAASVAGLAGLLVFFLSISWRRWPDPVIDFGRELYLPWRLAHGAVLYRDVDDFYGPLSQYLNAALFTTFGPGLMVLVTANLLILILIVALIYFLFRQAWGRVGATASTSVFLAIFAASQFADTGNFNYLTPYSEETTHGLFVCLTLVFVLMRWVEYGTRPGSFLAGLLFGLTLVLKPEFALAGGLLLAAALGIRLRTASSLRLSDVAPMTAGAILPTLNFFAFFAVSDPLPQAFNAAGRAWLNALTTTRFSSYNLELEFLGLDRPWTHLGNEAVASFAALVLFSGIAAAASAAQKITERWQYLMAMGLIAAVTFWISLHAIDWTCAARCLPGILLVYLILSVGRLVRSPIIHVRQQTLRLLLAVLALALLARMILRPRVFDYGYYQAALAAIMVPAVLIAELPNWLRLSRRGSLALTMATLTLFLAGTVTLSAISYQNLCLKTVPVGTGIDRFYSSRLDPTGVLVDSVSSALRAGPPTSTLLVLPEGVMINYLARLPSPIAPYAYYAAATAGGREDQIVADLQSHPPDFVVIISRPLLEYGITRYGSETDEGRQILTWVRRHYLPAFSRGGNPLDFTTRGVMVLTPRPGEFPMDAPKRNR
jgi:hypothetical protein